MTIDYFALAVDQARTAFTPPPSAPPSICCAAYGYVVDKRGPEGLWRCPLCNKSWLVQK